MTELEKMQRAKMYIDNLANGIDPITGTPVPEADTVNNIRISRCLFYVSDILRQIIDNKGVIGKAKTRKLPFFLSAEDVEKFPISDTPISISEITRRLNDLADLNVYKKLKHSDITGWLITIGVLEAKNLPDGKSIKRPTAQGIELGISTEKRTGRNGEYTGVFYNKAAQQFILDNFEAVLASLHSKADAQ